jgi:membrane protease YdiL (CAAX protease family)
MLPPSNRKEFSMRDWLTSRPLRAVLLLEAAAVGLVVLGEPLLGALFPDLPGYSVMRVSVSLILVLVAAAALLGLIAACGWWTLAGYTHPRDWRDLRLYWLPVLLLAVPFLGGVDHLSASTLLLLVVAYAATGIYEEGMWRGVQLGLLTRTGIWKAVLISSALFGLAHLGNSLLRGFSVIILAQAFGAAVQGIGWAALRLRTNTIWPLVAIHAAHDLFLQLGTLPIAMIEPPIDTITALYGVYLLRGAMRDRLTLPGASSSSAAPVMHSTDAEPGTRVANTQGDRH